MLKSIRDSKDVAQNLESPSKAGCSRSCIVSFIISASLESSFNENWFRISGSLSDEKGIESAT